MTQGHRGLLSCRGEEGPPAPGLQRRGPPVAGVMVEQGMNELASRTLALPGVTGLAFLQGHDLGGAVLVVDEVLAEHHPAQHE